MFSPSEIQRADDLVGIEMPIVSCAPDAAGAVVAASAGAAVGAAAGAVVAAAAGAAVGAAAGAAVGAAAGAAEPQLLRSTASTVKTAITNVVEILFTDFSFLN